MQKVVSGLLLAGLFVMMFFSPGAAFAYEEPQPEGQLITEKSYIGMAYFQVWQHSNGRWQDTDQDGAPDKPGQVKSWDFEMPGSLESLSSKWDLTGVRVRFLPIDQWSEATYQSYKGYKGLPFSTFYDQILNYSAAKCGEGKVWAEEHFPTYTLRYDGIRLATEPGVSDEEAAKKQAMNLKKEDNRSFVQSLGIPMSLPSGAGFSEMAAGYIYWVPYIVEVWGTPKGATRTPNFYVKDFDPGCPKEPVQTASGDPNVIGLLAQSESYAAVPGQKYTARVVFGANETEADPDTVFPAVASIAGLHKVGNTWYAADLKAESGDAMLKKQDAEVNRHLAYFRNNGSELVVEFDWTAENTSETTLAAAINLKYPPGAPKITPVWWEGIRSPGIPVSDSDLLNWVVTTVDAVIEGHASYVKGDNLAVATIKLGAPDLYVKSLNPGTSETEPGEKYNGTVTFGLKDTFNKPVTAILEFTHNGYPVRDTEGQFIDGRIIILDPGEEMPVNFTFTGLNEDSHLVAKIRPVHYSADADWSNNSKEVIVPAKKKNPEELGSRDLSIKWGSRKTAMQPGEKFKFSAVVGSSYSIEDYYGDFEYWWYNEGFYTYVAWRVDGKQVSLPKVRLDNWDDTITSSYTFTMPKNVKGDYVVLEAEVNPNKNLPDNESNWNNNKTEKLVVKVIKGPDDIDKEQPIWFTQ